VTGRGPWRLFGVLGSSPSLGFNLHPGDFTPFGLRRKMIHVLEMEM